MSDHLHDGAKANSEAKYVPHVASTTRDKQGESNFKQNNRIGACCDYEYVDDDEIIEYEDATQVAAAAAAAFPRVPSIHAPQRRDHPHALEPTILCNEIGEGRRRVRAPRDDADSDSTRIGRVGPRRQRRKRSWPTTGVVVPSRHSVRLHHASPDQEVKMALFPPAAVDRFTRPVVVAYCRSNGSPGVSRNSNLDSREGHLRAALVLKEGRNDESRAAPVAASGVGPQSWWAPLGSHRATDAEVLFYACLVLLAVRATLSSSSTFFERST